MKRIIISEWDIRDEGNYQLNIQKTNVNDCLGCWSCWIKTPGRCAHRDLDDFYHAFFQADRAVFYIQPSCDFISGKLKTLLDRMIVCALPYITYASGESHHEPRYKKIPAFEIYYKDEFSDQLFSKLHQVGSDLETMNLFQREIEFSKPYQLSKTKAFFYQCAYRLGLNNFFWHQMLKANHAFENRFDQPYNSQ